MKPGTYTNMPNAEYHGGDGISSSGLKLILDSPLSLLYASMFPKPQAPSMLLGSAVHSLVLEPDKNEVISSPEFNARTNAGKAEKASFHEENANKIILSPDQYRTAVAMRDSVMASRTASVLFSAGIAERSHFWTDPDTGELCKVRPDWFNTDMNLCVDLKTATAGSMSDFVRAVVNFSYELSAMYYLEGLEQTDTQAKEFVFVVVENKPPYLVSIYVLPDSLKQKGRVLWRRALDTYHQCKLTDTWPGYPDEIQVLDAPRWALNV